MTLDEIQQGLHREASLLGDYQNMSKTYLANKYCDAEEAMWLAQENGDVKEAKHQDSLRSKYLSALMLRYWFKIFKWKVDSVSLRLEDSDYISWLSKALWVAFYYKLWRYEYKAKVQFGKFIEWELDKNGNKIPNKYYYKNDDTAVDKIINQCCFSIRGREYQYANKDKRKCNTQTYSLDASVDENGDCALDYAGAYTVDKSYLSGSEEIIDMFIKKDKIIEAIIVDGIINYDTFNEKKSKESIIVYDTDAGEKKEETITKVTSEFNPKKLVRYLNMIDQTFIQGFCSNHSIEEGKSLIVFDKLKKMSNSKLYKYIEKTLIEIKQTPELLECLM